MPGARLTSPLGNAGASPARVRATARARVRTDRARRGLAPEMVLAEGSHLTHGHAPVAGLPTSPAWATWAPSSQGGRAPQGLLGSRAWWDPWRPLWLWDRPCTPPSAQSSVLRSLAGTTPPHQSTSCTIGKCFPENLTEDGVDAGFQPRHSGSGVHAPNQLGEVLTVGADSQTSFPGRFHKAPWPLGTEVSGAMTSCCLPEPPSHSWAPVSRAHHQSFHVLPLALLTDGQRLLQNPTSLPRTLSPGLPMPQAFRSRMHTTTASGHVTPEPPSAPAPRSSPLRAHLAHYLGLQVLQPLSQYG